MGFITDLHTHKHIYPWNNAKIGKNEAFHIHVKSEPGYSPKYPELVFSVIGLSLCRRGHDHQMRQITKCDGKDSWIVAICDCRILWRFKSNFSEIFHSNLGYTPKCRKHVHFNIKKVSRVHRLWALQLIYIHTNIYTSEITPKWAKMHFLKTCQKWTWVFSQVPRTRFLCYWTQFEPSRPWSQNATNHKMRRQGFLNCRNLWLSHFVTVQNTASQILVRSARGYTPQGRKHVHINVGHYQKVSFINWLLAL